MAKTATKTRPSAAKKNPAKRPAAKTSAAKAPKYVYLFGEVAAAEKYAKTWDGVRSLLGGKGANLADMTRAALPVPPGFTVTTEACNAFLAAGEKFPPGMWEQEVAALRAVEKLAGKKFGDPKNPLLVSCRSGAKFSMPGMMDTVLNIGLNNDVAQGMIALTGNERFVYDAYRRLVQMYGTVVLGVADEPFEEVLEHHREKHGVANDADLPAEDLKAITEEFKAIVLKEAGIPFPEDPFKQLELATTAVFKSWNGKRAFDYRKAAGIPHDLGTGVNIVTMVFGNMGNSSGTGVATTRNVSDGSKELEGDFLINAQGEDVVAGIRQTLPIAEMKTAMPKVYAQFSKIAKQLEKHYRDVQDVEFTIERGKLWMLQTRDAKRTAQAAIRIAVDLANEKLITKAEAVKRVAPDHVDFFLHPQFKAEAKKAGQLIATGLNVSPGAAVGQIAFDADTAERWAHQDKKAVIMVRPETKPDDVHGMLAAKGILTSRGGRTSHAALVARQFGKPAVVGVLTMDVDVENRQLTTKDGVVLKEGEWVSIDGTTGQVFAGQIEAVVPDFNDPYLIKLLKWADEIRKLEVWANADYPRDAERARMYGAQGIGLCRTEHMFFETERLPYVQSMILAKTPEDRAAPLAKLLPFQREDFAGLFKAMDGLPVTIRLIDPPLHEFLPSHTDLLRTVVEAETLIAAREREHKALSDMLSKRQKMFDAVEAVRQAAYENAAPVSPDLPKREEQEADFKAIESRIAEIEKVNVEAAKKLESDKHMLAAVESMHEQNPMLGLRGVRLGIHMPELTRMQVRAIFEAACDCAKAGIDVHPKIMIPLTAHSNELKLQQTVLEEEAKAVMAEKKKKIDYMFGTMIEIPRAALVADKVAEYAQFFSFGTNDLTQTTFGISRDDAETGFLMEYLDKSILAENPFASIDQVGVGKLMKMGVDLGRQTRPSLDVGICGEHGGDPKTIGFCHKIGLNYVSCSPFRVPIARIAAAHAALGEKADHR